MPNIHFEKQEIIFKIVYFGPAMSGKTTNLIHIHKTLANKYKGQLVSLDTNEDRTLFFDFFPIELGKINGFGIRLNMFTVPGQTYYESSRRLILEGTDGIVFVADSQPNRFDENINSYRLMKKNLKSYNRNVEDFPFLLQYNKRDCEDKIKMGLIERELNIKEIPTIEAIATEGKGVLESISIISKQVIQKFQI